MGHDCQAAVGQPHAYIHTSWWRSFLTLPHTYTRAYMHTHAYVTARLLLANHILVALLLDPTSYIHTHMHTYAYTCTYTHTCQASLAVRVAASTAMRGLAHAMTALPTDSPPPSSKLSQAQPAAAHATAGSSVVMLLEAPYARFLADLAEPVTH